MRTNETDKPTWGIVWGFEDGLVALAKYAHETSWIEDDPGVRGVWRMTNRYQLAEGDTAVEAMADALAGIDEFMAGWENFSPTEFPEHPDNWDRCWQPVKVRVEGPGRNGRERLELGVTVRGGIGITALTSAWSGLSSAAGNEAFALWRERCAAKQRAAAAQVFGEAARRTEPAA